MRTYEDPVQHPADSPVAETRETHPAYAQISASRVSGHAVLYGSDFNHQHYVTISITPSELHRGLSYDRPHALLRGEIVEVALSEAQWAHFVSSMNQGSGTQCTVQHLHGKLVPQIPEPPDRKAQIVAEADEKMRDVQRQLAALDEELGELKLSTKQKDLLRRKLGMIRQQLFAGEATRLAYGTDEAKEGRDSFLEKRPRQFRRFPWHY